MILSTVASTAAGNGGFVIKIRERGPATLRADTVEYNDATGVYTAKGEVEIIRGSTKLFADQVTLNQKTMIAEAMGHVEFITQDHILYASRMVLDLNQETGKLYQGQIFIRSNNYYLRGDEVEKTGVDTYRIHHGEFTSCDGSDPAWTITGEDMEVRVEGYGQAYHTAFRIRGIPVLYSPYLFFPVKFKRQTGFLAPELGHSDRDGFLFSLPWFWAIGDDMDATFTLNYLAKRGVLMGGEFRYYASPMSKGLFRLDYMADDAGAEDEFAKGVNAEVYEERWWFRGKLDQYLFGGKMLLKLDLDLVSDQDYLREFTFGYSGWGASNQGFIQWLGRDLAPHTQTTRKNQLNLSRSWAQSAFNFTLLYYDNLATDNKSTLQELPAISFDATRQAVGDTGLYFQMDSDYRYWYRERGSKGHIADVNPTLSLPLNFNDYLELEPRFSYAFRMFSMDRDTNEDPGQKTSGMNGIWSGAINTSSYLFRVFDFSGPGRVYKVKHAARPFVNWYYAPQVSQDNLIDLASRSLARTNAFNYGINNTFTSKTMGRDPQTGEVRPLYREFLRINLSQVFDLEEHQRGDSGSDSSRPWGDIRLRVEFDPHDLLYLETDWAFNPNTGNLDEVNAQLIAKDYRGDELKVDYRYFENQVNQLSLYTTLKITKEWGLRYIWRTDLVENRDFENSVHLRYQGQCWGFSASYYEKLRDRGFFITFSIAGFGDLFSLSDG